MSGVSAVSTTKKTATWMKPWSVIGLQPLAAEQRVGEVGHHDQRDGEEDGVREAHTRSSSSMTPSIAANTARARAREMRSMVVRDERWSMTSESGGGAVRGRRERSVRRGRVDRSAAVRQEQHGPGDAGGARMLRVAQALEQIEQKRARGDDRVALHGRLGRQAARRRRGKAQDALDARDADAQLAGARELAGAQ